MFCDQPCFWEAPGRTRHRAPNPTPRGPILGALLGPYIPGWRHLSSRKGVSKWRGSGNLDGPSGRVSLERGVKKTAPGDLAGAPGGASKGPPI